MWFSWRGKRLRGIYQHMRNTRVVDHLNHDEGKGSKKEFWLGDHPTMNMHFGSAKNVIQLRIRLDWCWMELIIYNKFYWTKVVFLSRFDPRRAQNLFSPNSSQMAQLINKHVGLLDVSYSLRLPKPSVFAHEWVTRLLATAVLPFVVNGKELKCKLNVNLPMDKPT